MTWVNLMKLREAAEGGWLDTMNGAGGSQQTTAMKAAGQVKAILNPRKASAGMLMTGEKIR